MLINVAGRDAGHDEPRAARDELDPLDRSFRMRIFPAPQVVSGGPSHGVLRQASPGLAPAALKTRQVAVAGVGDGQERQTTPTRRHHLDLEPLPDGRDHDLTASKGKRILRDSLADGVTTWCARFEQPMRDDHPPRQPADPDRHRGAGQQEAPLRRRWFRPDQERQAAQVHPPQRNIARLIAKNAHTRVARSRQVHWLIARHASDRRASGRADPNRFRPARGQSRTCRGHHHRHGPLAEAVAGPGGRVRQAPMPAPQHPAEDATAGKTTSWTNAAQPRSPRPTAPQHTRRWSSPGSGPGLRITGRSAHRKTA